MDQPPAPAQATEAPALSKLLPPPQPATADRAPLVRIAAVDVARRQLSLTPKQVDLPSAPRKPRKEDRHGKESPKPSRGKPQAVKPIQGKPGHGTPPAVKHVQGKPGHGKPQAAKPQPGGPHPGKPRGGKGRRRRGRRS